MADYDFSRLTEGINNLKDGYIAYAKEVIVNRALPALQDGLKPAQRRALVALHQFYKKGEKVKSQDLEGATMKLHPHGGDPIYSAFVGMTDRNEGMALPLLCGQGNFGNVRTADTPAASRYTKVWMHPNAEEYFKDMAGATIVPSYDGHFTEPVVLPVSYPAVLCNAQKGIAVAFSCNTPSFNFNDVIDLTLEYIQDGKCHTVIYPDFVTGGFLVKNNKEMEKLMKTGKAKLKLRGRVEKVGSELTVVEFPYGVKTTDIVKKIGKANLQGIKSYGDTTDLEHGFQVSVLCSKGKADEVLLGLYRDTDLQTNFSADLFLVLNDMPVRLGVWDVVAEWVKWRREVVTKKLKVELAGIKEKIKEARAFITVFNDKEKLDNITHKILKESDDAAVSYILENFDNEVVTPELARWIVSRRINVFRTGGKYATEFEQLSNDIKSYEYFIEHVDEYIVSELKDLKAREGSKHPRRTELTTTDYEFRTSEEDELDTNICYFSIKSNFIKKSRFEPTSDVDMVLQAKACDTLIALDNRGRIIRIYCEDLPYSGASELGTYLPKYGDFEETDDYRVTWFGVLDGSTKMLLYTDGNVGFLDTSEWTGLSRRNKVIEKGISAAVADKLGAVFDEIPETFYVVDNEGRLGYACTGNIKRKDRTARTRVFNLKSNNYITAYAPMTLTECLFYVENPSNYAAPKLSFLESEESIQGEAEFIPTMNFNADTEQ